MSWTKGELSMLIAMTIIIALIVYNDLRSGRQSDPVAQAAPEMPGTRTYRTQDGRTVECVVATYINAGIAISCNWDQAK